MITVLILEDNLLSRRAMAQIIVKNFDYKVLEASNGVEGISHFSEEPPNLILLDVHMPVMDGLQFLTTIRNNPAYKDIPVIVITADQSKDLLREMMKVGISDFILKPIDQQEIKKKVKYYIEKSLNSNKGRSLKKSKPSDHLHKKILIIDEDIRFSRFAKNQLAERFKTFEAKNSAEGLQIYQKLQPEIILLGENLSIINETLLAENIRKLDTNYTSVIFLCNEDGGLFFEEEDSPFDGVLKKTNDPQVFVKDFNQKVLGIETVYDLIMDAVTNIREDPGLLTSEKVGSQLGLKYEDIDLPPFSKLTAEMWVILDVKEMVESLTMSFIIIGRQSDLRAVTTALYKRKIAEGASVMRCLQDFAKDFCVEFQNILLEKGVQTEIGGIKIKPNADGLQQHKQVVMLPLESEEGNSFILAMVIHNKEGK